MSRESHNNNTMIDEHCFVRKMMELKMFYFYVNTLGSCNDFLFKRDKTKILFDIFLL